MYAPPAPVEFYQQLTKPQEPPVGLPVEFEALESILQRLPIKTASGAPGLLAQGRVGEVVDSEFPNLVEHIEKFEDDQFVLTALYRDYGFLASSYLLEPCHLSMLKSGGYGFGREVLPENISMPLSKVAKL